MIYDQTQSGIIIDTKIRSILNLAVIQCDNNQSKLARRLGIPRASVPVWLGKVSTVNTASISWPQWTLIRPVLADMGLLDPTDPDWLLPSEMRDALKRQGLTLPEDEQALVAAYRSLSPEGKQTARQVLAGLKATMPRQA